MSVDSFQVGLGAHLLSGFVHHTPWLWKALAGLESRAVGSALTATKIAAPVWVSGLARSGSTILLEILASHPTVATHQYRDFPFVAIPYWWRSTLASASTATLEAAERAHGDRLIVTPASPEAMEEPLWMMFFESLHDPSRSHVLDGQTQNAAFESFFADHMRKLLVATGRSRYVAKANYNVTRFGYLQRMYTDARFVVPVRDPRTHVASLRKQHRIFSEAAQKYPRSVAHLNRVGHFEFGANRRPINAGDADIVASIEELWASGEDVRGWARSWAHVYGFAAKQLASLSDAALVVRYEALCAQSGPTLERLFAHTGLAEAGAIIDEYRPKLEAPTYYKADFTQAEEQAIVEECEDVAAALGYDLRTSVPSANAARVT